MPRIPEANFQRTPSVRVENQTARIAAPETQDIKKLGGQFKDMANKLDNARITSEGLDVANEVNNLYDKEVASTEKYLKDNSKNGKTVQGKSITEEFNKVSLKFQTEAQARISATGNKIAADAYAKFTGARLQKAQNNMLILERKQQVDFADKQNKNKAAEIKERYKSGEDISTHLEEYKYMLNASSPLIGELRTAESLTEFEHLMGLESANQVRLNSSTKPAQDAAVAKARKWIAKLPEAQKIAAERDLEAAIKDVQSARLAATKQGVDEVSQHATNPKEVILNQAEWKRLGFSAITEPIAYEAGETNLERADMIGKLYGTRFGSLAAFQIRTGSLSSHDDLVDAEIKKFMDEGENAPAIKAIGRDRVESLIRQHAKTASRNFQAIKRQTGKAMAMFDESYSTNLFSGDPIRQQMALGQAYSFGKSLGLANEDITIMPPEEAENMAKIFNEADTGQQKAQVLANFMDSAGVNAFRMMKETIDMSKMPEIASAAIRMSDPNLVNEMMVDFTEYKSNMARLQERISGNYIPDIAEKNSKGVERALQASFSESKFAGLYLGRGGENHSLHKGMKDAVVSRAIKYMASKDMSRSDAFDQAIQDFDTQNMIGASDGQSFMVNKEFISRYAPTQDELNSTAKELKQLKHFDNKILPDVDWVAMTKLFRKSPILQKYAKVSSDAAGMRSLKGKKLATELFASQVPIEIAVDSYNPNMVKVYINPINGDRVPMLMKAADGGTEEMVIDLNSYFSAKREQDEEDREAFMKRVKQGSRLPKPEVVR